MDKFVYEIIRVRFNETEWSVLNRLGEDGWELCFVERLEGPYYKCSLYMKKKVVS